MIQLREFTPCGVLHPEDNKACEREKDHEPPHYYTVWTEPAAGGAQHPDLYTGHDSLYPVIWGYGDRRE